MTRILRIWNALLLSLLLAVTGQALAVARGAPLPAGQVQLCTGSGPVMVFLDKDGQPVKPPHFCPQGVLSLLNAVALAALPLVLASRLILVTAPLADRRGRTLRQPPAQARDPPLSPLPVS